MKMRESDSQEVVYSYDSSSDTLAIKATRNFKYNETVEMDDGIFLDFDVYYVPASLEIFDASKRLDLDCESLRNIVCLQVDICIDEKSISINATIGVLIDDVEDKRIFESFAGNYVNIPEIVTSLALA